MRIMIDKDVAEDPATHRFLDRLIAKVEDGWHLWEVTGLEGYVETSWIAQAGSRRTPLLELYQAAVRRSAYPDRLHGRMIHVTLTPSNADQAPSGRDC